MEQRIDQRRFAHIGASHKGNLVEIAGRKLFWSYATFDKLSSEDFHAAGPINGFKAEGKSQSDLSASLHIRSSSSQVNRPTCGGPLSLYPVSNDTPHLDKPPPHAPASTYSSVDGKGRRLLSQTRVRKTLLDFVGVADPAVICFAKDRGFVGVVLELKEVV